MKVKRESEVTQSCLTLSDPMDCSLPGSSIHGSFQARVLEWGAIAFPGGDKIGNLIWGQGGGKYQATWHRFSSSYLSFQHTHTHTHKHRESSKLQLLAYIPSSLQFTGLSELILWAEFTAIAFMYIYNSSPLTNYKNSSISCLFEYSNHFVRFREVRWLAKSHTVLELELEPDLLTSCSVSSLQRFLSLNFSSV